jgi:hypothetical protein
MQIGIPGVLVIWSARVRCYLLKTGKSSIYESGKGYYNCQM